MVIVPGKFIFLATPRTGSRAITEALIREHRNAITTYPKDHHAQPENPTLPIYSVVRNPVDQALSWWAHTTVNHHRTIAQRPLEWLETFNNPMFFPRYDKYVFNIHADLTDHFILYTEDLRNATEALGLKRLEVVGRSKHRGLVSDSELQELEARIRLEFPADVELYEGLLDV